jgi:hypothetical protein
MSWAIFKSNVQRVANSPESIPDIDTVANLYATEYDAAIKRGRDLINQIPLQQGNVTILESLIRLALLNGQNNPSLSFSLISEMGNAVIAYWTGAIMTPFPIPVIPAPGTIQNISVTSNIVLNPGTWAPTPPIQPTNSTTPFIDLFISTATLHLSTITGIINTVSLYPTVPSPTPGPGVINWVGYSVPPSTPGLINLGVPASALILTEIVQQKVQNADFSLDSEGIQIKQQELEGATETLKTFNDQTSVEYNLTEEYVELIDGELQSGQVTSATIELEEEEVKSMDENTDEELTCEIGKKIVEFARKDIGTLETGTKKYKGAGRNYGGLQGKGETAEGVSGRIDDMVKLTGLNNQNQVKNTGEGYYWCAAAVTAWWKAAGLKTPSGSAACKNWAKWGKQNNQYSKKPVIGAAVLYGKEGSEHHIGIVESILPDGTITTIEGNTGGGGFNRNGCGCFRKTPRLSNVSGYVIPTGCGVPK